MSITRQEGSVALYRDILADAMTDGEFFTVSTPSSTPPVVGTGGSDGEDCFRFPLNSDKNTLTVQAGHNWESKENSSDPAGWYHPDQSSDECNDFTFPGQVWSDSINLGNSYNPPGYIWYDNNWAFFYAYENGTFCRIALSVLNNRPSNYQTFSETVNCTDSDGNDYTTTGDGYNSVMYTACMKLGGWNGYGRYGTITGGNDVRTTLTGKRTDGSTYERDDEWELGDHNNDLAGDHERWIENDGNPRMGHRSKVEASGTYRSLRPPRNDALIKVT